MKISVNSYRNVFSHDDVSTGIKKGQKLGNALQQLFPVLWLHGVTDLGIVVEDGGDDCELNFNGYADAEVVSLCHSVKLMQHFNLLTSIST